MIPIVINHSSPHFIKPSEEVAEGLRKAGEAPEIITNDKIREKINRRYAKCVFFDKDIPLGLELEFSGTRLYNNIGAIELCSDKRRTYAILKNDIPTPKTEIYPLTYFPDENKFAEYAEKLADILGLPLIAKLSFGSQGREVFLLNAISDIIEFQQKYYATPHLYQRFVSESRGCDIRVYIVGGKVEAAMIRENKSDFRSNVEMGGTAKKTEISNEIENICIDVFHIMGLDFCGIDILIDKHGTPLVCEVNSNALFGKINEVCGVKIGHKIAELVTKTEKKSDFMF